VKLRWLHVAVCTLAVGCSEPIPERDVDLLEGSYDVVLETSLGDITLHLEASDAPKAVTNFVVHTREGYYDGLTFHRVIYDFMIQGGDPLGDGTGGQSVFGPDFEDEPNDTVLDRGVLAMANAGPNTNGSQFFIIQAAAGTPHLQGRHTAFGRVTDGMDVVDAIASVPTNPRNDRPLTPVTMTPREL